MSVNMLGDEHHGEPAMDGKEIDNVNLIKSPDPGKCNRKSKTSPSIKSFFQSKEPEEEDNESVNKQDIKKFFMPQRKTSHEKPIKAQTCLIQDSDSDELSTCNTDDRANSESSRISHLDVEEYQAVKSKAHKTPTATKKQEERDGSLKKAKQKWSLSWRVSKKSKKYKDSGSDSDFEDVTGLDCDKQESRVGIKKERRKQDKSETNEVESCSETKSKPAELKNEEGKGKKGIKQKTAEREIPEATTKKKGNYEVKEKNNQKGKDEQSLTKRSKKVVLENKGTIDVLEVKESKTTPVSQSIPSSSPNNQVKSAFDVLMNQPKIHVAVDDECDKSVILVPTDEDVCTHVKDGKVESIMDKEKYPQNSSSSSSGCGNAFDIMMTKKKTNNGDGEISKKSPQKSKNNSSKFKLSIHYSKPLKFDDKSDDDDTSPVIHEQQTSTVHTCRKNTKIKQDNKVLQKESEDVGDDIKSMQARKKRKSKTDPETKSSIVKTPKEKKRTDVVNITDTPEETVELVEEQSEMTKVKKKKKIKTKTAESSSKTSDTRNTPIEIQEDSNSSIQEIPANDLPNKTPKTRSLGNKVIISPRSEDFEVAATRTGLRKRTNPKNYATMSEPAGLSSDDKKKKKDKQEKEQPVTIPDSPEVEMTCKATKKKREDEKTASAPQNLASIFTKQKPKTSEKKESTPAQQVKSTKTVQSKNECNKPPHISNLMDEAELKAANNAFNALFNASKLVKTQVSVVPTCQQPTPWPTVSHVTQKNDDQSDEEFWKLSDSKIEALPWEPESVEDFSQLKSRALQLGEFTNSSYRSKRPEEKDKLLHNRLPSDGLSTVVFKNLLSEIASFFPGIPIKRLYKQYKNKDDEGKKDGESLLKEDESSKRCEEEAPSKANKGNDCLRKAGEESKKGKGRSKRKISTQSDDELSEKQHKKVPRTKEKDDRINIEKCKDVDTENASTKRSRKKRGRDEEEEEEIQGRQNCKRKSARIQKRSDNDIDREEPQQEEKTTKSSRRKKRKTMEDDKNVEPVSRETEKSEDSRASLDEKKNPDKKDLLWTEKYQPECSSEVMGNASSVSRLRSWLEAWKIKRQKTLRKELELQKRLLAKQKNKDSSEKKSSLEWWEEDHDSDFRLSDEDSEDSDSEESGICNAMLVLGPKGAGKTATVYACAKELGYKVFEVNCSSKRSSKQILSRLEEATQSHLVITNPSANTPKASAFSGLFGSIPEKPVNPSPMSNFFKKSNEVVQEDNKASKKNERKKKAGQDKSEKEKERKAEGKEKEEEKGKYSSNVLTSTGDSESNPRLSLKAASLILFEEVDVIFEDDKGFWSAVNSFMRNAKCPIVMTSNDARVDCDGRYEQLILKAPSVNLLSAHLLITALVNNVFVNPPELKTLASLYKCDIRKCLLGLQFWILSGAGTTMNWDELSKGNEAGTNQAVLQLGSESKTIVQGEFPIATNDGESTQVKVEQPLGLLDDPGEESLFLTLDDWKTLAKRPTQASRRGLQSGTNALDIKNDDSDFEPAKRSSHAAMDDNTHTDSIFDVNEPNDSQSVQIADNETTKVAIPDVHCMLVEHVLGVLNNTRGYDNGSMDLLKQSSSANEEDKDFTFTTRCNLAYHSQKLGINLLSNNLPTLLPSLHTDRSPNEHKGPVTKATKESADTGRTQQEEKDGAFVSMFSDRSLFDDGSEDKSNDGDGILGIKKTKPTSDKKGTSLENTSSANEDLVDDQSNTDVVAMTTDNNSDVAIVTQNKQCKKHKTLTQELQGKTLEIFSGLAEDMSYLDAYIPTVTTDACHDRSAAFGWWHARVRAGLSDDVVTIRERRDWLTVDTSACIRGALEVSSLESSYNRYNALVELSKKRDVNEESKENKNKDDKETSCETKILPEDLDAYLPRKEAGSVVNLTGLSDAQSSTLSTRNKLYRTVSSSLPMVTHCAHRAVSMEYLPSLRTICHAERLREIANTKRRFLHYLDSTSLSLSKPSQQGLADAYLTQ